MIEIEEAPWATMVRHAESAYPNECCGAMLGRLVDGRSVVTSAVPLENSFAGGQQDRYEVSPADLLKADIGLFHSHPDCDAYFSETDLKNSCPWYSFVVLSIKAGKFDHANSFRPDYDQSKADKEELKWPKF